MTSCWDCWYFATVGLIACPKHASTEQRALIEKEITARVMRPNPWIETFFQRGRQHWKSDDRANHDPGDEDR